MSKRNRDMCVRIARDVLLQLRLGRFIAESGTYVYANTSDIDPEESFKQVFQTNKNITCAVCALGSAFVSLVNIENKCSVEQMNDADNMFKRLSKYFGNDNIALMESAFECIVMDSVDNNV